MPDLHLRDHGLDPRALLVALTVDLLRARQQRLDVVAEVDEHVVAVAGLLHDPRDDVADAVDVLRVPDRALRLADALLDHLLRRHRGDAAEVLRGRVGPGDLMLGDLVPVELELVVVDQRVLLLAGLLLDSLELLDLRLARLVEQALLEVGGDLDREDAELALFVELHDRVARGARRLLVRGEQGILERADQLILLDAFLPLERANVLDDLDAHLSTYPLSIRLPRTISSYGISSAPAPVAMVTARSPAATSSPRKRVLPAISCPVFTVTLLPTRPGEVRGLAERPLRPRRRHVDGELAAPRVEEVRDALAERVVDPAGMVDVHADPARRHQLERQYLDAGQAALDRRCDLPLECLLSCVDVGHRLLVLPAKRPLLNKNGRLERPFRQAGEMW